MLNNVGQRDNHIKGHMLVKNMESGLKDIYLYTAWLHKGSRYSIA